MPGTFVPGTFVPGTLVDISGMFSMRCKEEVIRRSRIQLKVGLVVCEISCERELFKRN